MNNLFNNLFRKAKEKRIYLDHAATTPVRREVFLAMEPYFSEIYGNPSAVHQEGVIAKKAVEEARASLARTLRVRASDAIFTSGGTESNNLAIYGILRHLNKEGTPFHEMEVISTRLEHPSVAEVQKDLAELGVTIKYVAVDNEGLIDQQNFTSLLSKKTVLVTLAYVNSEIGVVQDVKRLSRVIKSFNQTQGTKIRFHLDAAQAPLWLPVQLDSLGADLIALDAGKCCGPKGVGVLAFNHQIKLAPISLGGAQERGLRAGTENVPLVVGCALAIEIAQREQKDRSIAVSALRDYFLKRLTAEIPVCVLNGSAESRVANNVNISIKGIDTEYAVVVLDKHGVAASTKSACSGASGGGSTVVREIYRDEDRAVSTIRFSLGENTKKSDLDYTIKILSQHVAQMRVFQKTLT